MKKFFYLLSFVSLFVSCEQNNDIEIKSNYLTEDLPFYCDVVQFFNSMEETYSMCRKTEIPLKDLLIRGFSESTVYYDNINKRYIVVVKYDDLLSDDLQKARCVCNHVYSEVRDSEGKITSISCSGEGSDCCYEVIVSDHGNKVDVTIFVCK